MTKKLLNRRQWLRPAKSWGPESSIHTTVSIDKYNDAYSLSGTINLRDCSQSIGFDFEADTLRQANHHIAMLDKLINEISRVQQSYQDGIDFCEDFGWNKGL